MLQGSKRRAIPFPPFLSFDFDLALETVFIGRMGDGSDQPRAIRAGAQSAFRGSVLGGFVSITDPPA